MRGKSGSRIVREGNINILVLELEASIVAIARDGEHGEDGREDSRDVRCFSIVVMMMLASCCWLLESQSQSHTVLHN